MRIDCAMGGTQAGVLLWTSPKLGIAHYQRSIPTLDLLHRSLESPQAFGQFFEQTLLDIRLAVVGKAAFFGFATILY